VAELGGLRHRGELRPRQREYDRLRVERLQEERVRRRELGRHHHHRRVPPQPLPDLRGRQRLTVAVERLHRLAVHLGEQRRLLVAAREQEHHAPVVDHLGLEEQHRHDLDRPAARPRRQGAELRLLRRDRGHPHEYQHRQEPGHANLLCCRSRQGVVRVWLIAW
jgi:hypothetical protein